MSAHEEEGASWESRTGRTDSRQRTTEDQDVDRLGSRTDDGSHLEERDAGEKDEFGWPNSKYLSEDEEERRLSEGLR